MKLKYKRILQSIFVNDIIWYILYPSIFVAKRLELSRQNFIHRKTEDENIAICEKLFAGEQVLNGIFKGLKFKNIKATGSSIYAKLLGSYEMELEPVLQKMFKRKYDYFINVGCDEGYYAVGIAKKIPGVKVIAFDCNKDAQKRCSALAELNQVQQSINIKGCFSLNEIEAVATENNILFIVDCEGCENEIITQYLINKFTTADFIIELHFEKVPLVLLKLQELFAASHHISLINALSDHERVLHCKFSEIEHLSYQQQKFILEEREGFMQWLIARPVNIVF